MSAPIRTHAPAVPDAPDAAAPPVATGPPPVVETAALPRPGIRVDKPRLAGIDVARGLALLGMMAVHAMFLFDQDFNPTWVTPVALGNASALFAVLAGVGLSLTTGRKRVPWSKARMTAGGLVGRAVAVGVIGLALGYVDAEIAGVILPYYAVLFVLAVPLVLLPTPWLVVVGVLAATAVPVVSQLVRPGLPAPSLDNPGFTDLIGNPGGLLAELTLTGEYPALPWLSYLCAGLLVGRLTLSSARVARRLLLGGAALAVAAKGASAALLGPLGGAAALQLAGVGVVLPEEETVDDLLTFGFDGVTPTNSWWWLATSSPHAGTPPDLLYTIGLAVAVLGAMLLLGHIVRPVLRWTVGLFTVPLAAAGSMTLTLYTAHVVFMSSPLDVFGATEGYVLQVVLALLFALGWRQAVGRGPLETLVTAVADRARRLVPPAGQERGGKRGTTREAAAVPTVPLREGNKAGRSAGEDTDPQAAVDGRARARTHLPVFPPPLAPQGARTRMRRPKVPSKARRGAAEDPLTHHRLRLRLPGRAETTERSPWDS